MYYRTIQEDSNLVVENPNMMNPVHLITIIWWTTLVNTTGPAIILKNGHHIHYFKTKVEFINGHIHNIYGYTSTDKFI